MTAWATLVAALLLPAAGFSAGPGTGTDNSTQRSEPSPDSQADFDARALARMATPPLGLPELAVPADNRPTAARIRLGRKLFLDRRLSGAGTLSCAMCHVPEQGFTVHESRTAVGNAGKNLRRNAPTLLNVAYLGPFFHDGREPDLDLQPFDVFLNPDEMAAPSLGAVVETVASLSDYGPLFKDAFGNRPTVESIGQALGTYMRTLLAADSPFDRARYGDEPDALSTPARRGLALFTGKAACSACHTLGHGHALLTDGLFHDTGLGWHTSMVRRGNDDPVPVEITPGRVTALERSVVDSVGEPLANDLGRYEVTGKPADRWRFKTPSLRNVAVTAPYMHDGSFSTLRQVVEFYNQGGHRHDGLDPLIVPLGLDEQEMGDLVAFLNSLTAGNLDELVNDARSERVGNPGDVP